MGAAVSEKVNTLINGSSLHWEMESLTSKMERFQLEEKVVSLMISGIKCVLWQHLEEEWRGIEFTCEHDGVEFTVGELKVLIF